MKSTRQFTKRRPQSPPMQQLNAPTGTSKLTMMPSVAAVTVQSSAPLRANNNTIRTQESSKHQHQEPSQPMVYEANPYPSAHPQQPQHAAHDDKHNHDAPHLHGQPSYHPHSNDHGHASEHFHDHHHHVPGHHDHHHPEHEHDHDHNHHHHHHHHHQYPAVSIPDFPSWAEIFAGLLEMQKTTFTWFLIHCVVGVLVWWAGASRDSLAIVGLSYLVIFDALGVLNTFISDIAKTNPAFLASNTKRPFSARRYEIVFAMATMIYLLFVTMYTIKESLEHILTEGAAEGHHEQDHAVKSLGFGGLAVLTIAMGATVISCVGLKNHDNLVRHLRRSPPTVHGYSYNVINGTRGNAINIVLSNIYSTSIIASCLVVLLFFMFGFVSPVMDKFLAFGESVVMLYLGGPTALALMKLLLQTTPDATRSNIESRLFEIRQNPDVVAIDRVHFWQNSYGKCVGTVEVQVKPSADEESVLQFVYKRLEGLTTTDTTGADNSSYPKSELTVSIIKQ